MKIQWFVLVCDWLFLLGIYRSAAFAYCSLGLLSLRYSVVLIWGTVIYFKDDMNDPRYEIALNLVMYMLIDSILLCPLQFFSLVFKLIRKEG
jgi:hypothetical protein